MNTTKKSNKIRGVICTLAGGTSWGFSGACGQFLLSNYALDTKWLTGIRMIVAGLILIAVGFYKDKKNMVNLLKDKKDFIELFIFSVAGLMFCQLAYINAIGFSNAGTATVLQYIAPVFIMLYVCIKDKRIPNLREGVSVFLVLAGTFILATHGNVKVMVLTPNGLKWGIFAALGLALYTLIPVRIMKKWGSVSVTGYGMFIGGIVLAVLGQIWNYPVSIDILGIFVIMVITLVGTLLAFSLYLQGVNDIGSVKASMLASVEPVSATIFAYFWLHSEITSIDLLGFALILATVFILAKNK